MHAVIVTVTIADGQFEASRKVLHDDVVPQVSKAPGFVKGYWTAAPDRRSATSIVVFKRRHVSMRQSNRRCPPRPSTA